jgi:hypothetical protein
VVHRSRGVLHGVTRHTAFSFVFRSTSFPQSMEWFRRGVLDGGHSNLVGGRIGPSEEDMTRRMRRGQASEVVSSKHAAVPRTLPPTGCSLVGGIVPEATVGYPA